MSRSFEPTLVQNSDTYLGSEGVVVWVHEALIPFDLNGLLAGPLRFAQACGGLVSLVQPVLVCESLLLFGPKR